MDAHFGEHAIEQQISRNRLISLMLFVAGLLNAAIVAVVAGAIAGAGAGALVFVAILAWIAVAYLIFEMLVMRSTGAREPTAAEEARLRPMVEDLAGRFQMETPRIKVVDDPAANAFAIGSSPRRSTVTFTTGLLSVLDNDELRGVAAHELSHVANYDSRMSALSAALLGWALLLSAVGGIVAFAIGAWGIASIAGAGGGSNRDWTAVLASICVGVILICAAVTIWFIGQTWFLLAQMAHLGVHRQREWLADSTAVRVTGQPLHLASALAKVAEHETRLSNGSMLAQSLCIAGVPKSGNWLTDLMSTHPDISRRIDRLRGYGGLTPLSGALHAEVDIVQAARTGAIAGVAMIVFVSLFSAMDGVSLLDPLAGIGYRVLEHNYVWDGPDMSDAVLALGGLPVHLAVSVLLALGFVVWFGDTLRHGTTARYMLWGVLFGLGVWALASYAVLPVLVFGPEGIESRLQYGELFYFPLWGSDNAWLLGHVVFGAVLGYALQKSHVSGV